MPTNTTKKSTNTTKAKATPKTNNLTLTKIKNKAKQNNEQIVYTFSDSTELKFYSTFPDSKIETLLIDMQELLKDSEGLEMDDRTLYHFMVMMCVKHFTSLKTTIKGDLAAHINFMESLIDSGYYEEMINEMFMSKEIQRVLDKVGTVIASYQAIGGMMDKAKSEFERLELQNADVFKGFGNKKKQVPEA